MSDTASGLIESFVFRTDRDDFRPENAQFPWIDTGTNADATVFQIGQTSPTNTGAGPLIDLGDIFPVRIESTEALGDYLTLAEYASELGAGGVFDIIVVPEPSGCTAVATVVLLLAPANRRRRQGRVTAC